MTEALRASYWPVERLGEAMAELARRARLTPRSVEAPRPPEQVLEPTRVVLERWMESAARWLGLEAQLTETPYAELTELIRGAAPCLLRMETQGPHFLAVLGRGQERVAVVGPDLVVRRIPVEAIRSAMMQTEEAPLFPELGAWLVEAGVPPRQRARVRAALLRERMRSVQTRRCWHLRLPPGAKLLRQVRRAGLPRQLSRLLLAHTASYLLLLFSWWLVGRGALQQRLDPAWLVAWVLALLALILFRLWASWTGGRLALDAGALLKQRLMAGALSLEPEEIRHEGVGQLLGRVIESGEIELLALQGGVVGLVSVLELGFAAGVLGLAAGAWPVLLLIGWLVFVAALAWRYYRRREAWTGERLDMTHALVERLVGHRTRLAQELPEHWHDGEDGALDRYLASSRGLDRSQAILTAVSSRGWPIVGLLGLAPTLVAGHGDVARVAVALGGVLLAGRALQQLTQGFASLAGAAISWRRISELYRAAAREELAPPPDAIAPFEGSEGPALLEASHLVFRHPGRAEPVLAGCDLRILSGDRLLLEGPSGGGKSTLGAVLAGLRVAERGLLLLDGLDRRTLGPEGWRRRVVVAPQFQENHVLTGTFAFNLLMGRAWPPRPGDMEEAERLCRALGLGPLLDRMPAGLHQAVGETGWQLSHGERSRLYMARALLQGAELVILDESFAALDPETLGCALRCALEHAGTLMVIAHP